MAKYYIAWNGSKTEGYVTNTRDDARHAAGQIQLRGVTPSLGDEFRECYGDEKCTVEEVDI